MSSRWSPDLRWLWPEECCYHIINIDTELLEQRILQKSEGRRGRGFKNEEERKLVQFKVTCSV